MSGGALPRVLGLLGLEKDPAVDDALREALPHLAAESREAALKMICQRGSARAMQAVLVASPTYDASLREAVFRRLDDFQTGLRAALQSDVLADRSAAIVVIVAARDFKSLPLLGDALRSHCPRTRELAGNAIKALTHIHLLERSGPRAHRLAEVLRQVIATWEAHRHAAALEAAAWMIDWTGAALAEKIRQPSSKIIPALKELLDPSADPRLAGFFLWALADGDLRADAIHSLAQCRDEALIGALLDELWVLGDPAFSRALHGIRGLNGLHPKLVEFARTTPTRITAAVRAIAVSGSTEGAAAHLAALGEQAGDTLQRAVLWQLIGDESASSTQALRALAARTNDSRSSVARREVARRERREPVAAQARTNSAGDPLQKALSCFADERTQMTDDERAALAQQLATFGPDLIRALERKLKSPLASERAGTLAALAELDPSRTLAPMVYACCHDTDATVRLAALRALAGDAGATATRLIREALHDPEPRVQAAAIELLEQRGVEKNAAPVRDKMRSPHNRVRANAIKALWTLQAREAATALETMLKDPLAAHRISALWVVERLGIRDILAYLMEMERKDPDEAVRARARRVLRGLTESSRPVRANTPAAAAR